MLGEEEQPLLRRVSRETAGVGKWAGAVRATGARRGNG